MNGHSSELECRRSVSIYTYEFVAKVSDILEMKVIETNLREYKAVTGAKNKQKSVPAAQHLSGRTH